MSRPNAMAVAVKWALGVIKEHAGVDVTVSNGETSIEIRATLGSVKFATINASDNFIRYTAPDFIVDRLDLRFDGVVRLPTRDWTIERVDNGKRYRYQPSAPDGEQVFRVDATNQMVHIHTTLIGVVDA